MTDREQHIWDAADAEIERLRGMIKTAYGYMLEHKSEAVVIEWLERADAVVKHEG